MEHDFVIYNTLTKRKEKFEPLNSKFVGMYVCGPTVYGDAHLGHARPAITFDLLFRYLRNIGYKVRYIRNITDVGHLEEEIGEGEDKIEKKAKLEQLEPMEVVQYYVDSFRNNMRQLNVLLPSIEPSASGHILEQQKIIEKIIEKGFAYKKNGSIYFDVKKYAGKFNYGELSGRNINDLLPNTRSLTKQDEKRNSYDFALWKKADDKHIMRWDSKWGEGFPGWHTECTAMSTKYLGESFDIHGGGIDLLFPHHECELAQFNTLFNKKVARYWVHNNMITINGKKMGKSFGNFITLNDFFTGNHHLLTKSYSAMTIRFFMLQAHYRTPLDFSNEALQASEKGLAKLMNAIKQIDQLPESKLSSINIKNIGNKCYEAANDDLNSPIIIAHLFDGVKIINLISTGKETITSKDKKYLIYIYKTFVYDILGLLQEENKQKDKVLNEVMEFILELRQKEKLNENYELADKIREGLNKIGIHIYDKKEGCHWDI